MVGYLQKYNLVAFPSETIMVLPWYISNKCSFLLLEIKLCNVVKMRLSHGCSMRWTKTEQLLWSVNELLTQTYYVRDKFILQCFVRLACHPTKTEPILTISLSTSCTSSCHQKVTKSRNKPQRLHTLQYNWFFWIILEEDAWLLNSGHVGVVSSQVRNSQTILNS